LNIPSSVKCFGGIEGVLLIRLNFCPCPVGDKKDVCVLYSSSE
jgi:hypothetical protein